MRRIGLAVVLALGLTLAPLAAEAQPAGKVARIGCLLGAAREQTSGLVNAFEDGLRDLGYVPGQNVVIEDRFADGKLERLPQFAQDLVRLKVDVIVTGSNMHVIAAKQATTTIPIVMVYVLDPVGAGLVANVSRPGGNVTGLSQDVGAEISGKRLALLKELVPKLSRVAVLVNAGLPGPTPATLKAMEAPARTLGVTVVRFDARGPGDLEGVFAAVTRARSDALVVTGGPVHFNMRTQVAQLALRHRLPSISPTTEDVEAGGLMSYGASLNDQWRRAAAYVDKILKGAQPGDLPVEQPTKFELVINLKTAKALGLTIPQTLLLQAERVIE
jgi:putative tryptophan/tyrosine transport system substrate-binding protein